MPDLTGVNIERTYPDDGARQAWDEAYDAVLRDWAPRLERAQRVTFEPVVGPEGEVLPYYIEFHDDGSFERLLVHDGKVVERGTRAPIAASLRDAGFPHTRLSALLLADLLGRHKVTGSKWYAYQTTWKEIMEMYRSFPDGSRPPEVHYEDDGAELSLYTIQVPNPGSPDGERPPRFMKLVVTFDAEANMTFALYKETAMGEWGLQPAP